MLETAWGGEVKVTDNGASRRSASDQAATDVALTLSELRSAQRPIVVTHENPDGDALGSLIAMHGILVAIGKDCQMFIDRRDLPLPQEYAFLPLEDLICEPPPDFRRAHDRVPGLRQPRPQPGPRSSARPASASSTSTTTTTTRASGPSTSSMPAPRARRRSSGS